MKTRETKQNDLNALTASLANSKSAMVMSFKGLSVSKDLEFRNAVREAGAEYQVVKNTLARIAVKGTDFEQASEHFKGVTAIAWTENDPVVLSKAISKFMKDNADIYTFKTGVVDGSLVDFSQLKWVLKPADVSVPYPPEMRTHTPVGPLSALSYSVAKAFAGF